MRANGKIDSLSTRSQNRVDFGGAFSRSLIANPIKVLVDHPLAVVDRAVDSYFIGRVLVLTTRTICHR